VCVCVSGRFLIYDSENVFTITETNDYVVMSEYCRQAVR